VPTILIAGGGLLYIYLVDGWLARRTEKLRLIGKKDRSADVIQSWIRRHRLLVFTAILTPVLLTAIGVLAVNRVFGPIKALGILTLVLVVSTAVHSAIAASRNTQRLIRFGSRATGTIIDKREEHGVTGGSMEFGPDPWDAYWVTYSFMPREGVEFHEECKVEQRMWHRLSVGSRVVIAFDPEDPIENTMLGRPEDGARAR
jgi:hypothetical protein